MSGRGRNGRGGRGGRRDSSSKKGRGGFGNKPPTKKKDVADYVYYMGSAKQASDFEKTNEFLINHIKQTFEFGNDIGTALKTLEPLDLTAEKPTLAKSDKTDKTERGLENDQFKIEFKSDYDHYRKRFTTYETNLPKAYAFLWQQSSKAMKVKIEGRVDFAAIDQNPIELLKAIKQHALNYQDQKYDMAIIHDSLNTMHGVKQKDGDNLQDYTRRFRTARDVMESHLGGPLILPKVVEAMEGYSETNLEIRDKFRKEASDRYLAYVYLAGSDQSKYGSILKGLNTQQSLGNVQYPKTITEANNVLSNHPFDAQKPKSRPAERQSDNSAEKKDKEEESLKANAIAAESQDTSRHSASTRTSHEKNGRFTRRNKARNA